jgi:hypothetical protein
MRFVSLNVSYFVASFLKMDDSKHYKYVNLLLMLLSFLLIGIFLASILLVEENVSVILSIWSKFVAYFLFMHKDQIIVLLYRDRGLELCSKLPQFVGADGVGVCSHCRWKGMLEIFVLTQSWRELMRSCVLSWPAT